VLGEIAMFWNRERCLIGSDKTGFRFVLVVWYNKVPYAQIECRMVRLYEDGNTASDSYPRWLSEDGDRLNIWARKWAEPREIAKNWTD
jgi:hypothetical protein